MENIQNTKLEERSLLEGILHYIAILLNYKVLVITLTLLAAVGSVAFSIYSVRLPNNESPFPNYYKAYSVIVFQEGGGEAAGMASMLSAFGVESQTRGAADPAQMALNTLQSRPFIDNLVEKFNIIELYGIKNNIKTNSRKIIQGSSEYSYNQDSGTLTITFTSINPVFAADIVNYEIELLREWFLREGMNTRSAQLTLMEEKLQELSAKIEVAENEIETFQKENGVLDINELAKSQSAILTDLRTRLNAVELEINDYAEYLTFEDPALIKLKNQRDNIITQIRRIENGYYSSDGRKMPSQGELPELALEFSHLQAEYTLQTQLYQSLSERYEVTKLAAAQSAQFSVLEEAEVPEEKAGPSRGQLCMKITLGAFAGSIALALFLNFLKKILKNPYIKEILKGKNV